MRGQDAQTGRMHVDEGHHDAIGAGETRVFVAEGKRGFVAMMAIGDEQFFVGHQFDNVGCYWGCAGREACATFQMRCTAPYSSVTSPSGGAAAAWSSRASISPAASG